MKIKKFMWIIPGIFFIFLLAVLFINKNSDEKNQDDSIEIGEVSTSDSSTKDIEIIEITNPKYEEMESALQTTEEFLKTFFTYEKVGDNQKALEKLSTQNLKDKYQDFIRVQELNNNNQNYANITYKSSDVYYHRINEKQFQVIAEVKTTFDILDSDGNVVKKKLENISKVKLLGEREVKANDYKIREFSYISLEDTDTTLK
ncbi:hypothetical protein [Enterococcus termitis]|uniref:Uncharacterized protein n=1 Tax=Enterococcus termitis TaxID=332950 RepID=A0A1E5H1A6_9ENTE|nr:hypothetical protein [Enterococcus termitis]OEG18683.1 hypothetical protein BCR25_15910 [Enterococcus termitis]OJG97590.1 hypothetical protein RV18_GL000658 [Enterococcus termitis]